MAVAGEGSRRGPGTWVLLVLVTATFFPPPPASAQPCDGPTCTVASTVDAVGGAMQETDPSAGRAAEDLVASVGGAVEGAEEEATDTVEDAATRVEGAVEEVRGTVEELIGDGGGTAPVADPEPTSGPDPAVDDSRSSRDETASGAAPDEERGRDEGGGREPPPRRGAMVRAGTSGPPGIPVPLDASPGPGGGPALPRDPLGSLVDGARRVAFPVVLLLLLGVYLALGGSIGRRDPKLAAAPLDRTEASASFR
ncbi:MAG TPA: hypothetical protein VNO17_03990 [Actinomycetota bacterium]|nr:hypothetical protein [Actinomycetota bacterium]